MNRAWVRAQFDIATREIFRLEVQQSYAGVEDPGWPAWQEGKGLAPLTPENREWYQRMRARADAGVLQRRVLVVEEPLDPYLFYEFAAFQHNIDAGEQIMVAGRAEHPYLATLRQDFWMFDESRIAIMNYDVEHRPTGPTEPDRPIAEYVDQRDLALAHATPLNEWMSEHPELLTA